MVRKSKNKTQEIHVKDVDLASIFESIRTLIYSYIDKVSAGEVLNPAEYKWSLFTQLDIPERSLMVPSGQEPPVLSEKMPFEHVVEKLFRPMNIDSKFQEAFSDVRDDGFVSFSKGYIQQVPWFFSVKEMYGKEVIQDKKLLTISYKIHITPKYEYLLYTLLRLFTIMKNNAEFHIGILQGKILLGARDCKPDERNTYLLELNGGAAPMIVIYSNALASTTRSMLDVLLREFQSEVDILGGMTSDYKYRVLPFNVRLNSLIQYAHGDRSHKLDQRDAFAKLLSDSTKNQRNTLLTKKYFKPSWISTITEKCGTSEEQEGNRLSMQFFGKNLCSPEHKNILEDPFSLDDINWMTMKPKIILDPMTLTNLVIEPEEIVDMPEADTTANNVVVSTDSGAPSSTKLIGGKSTRKRRHSRQKTRKNKHN